MKRALTLAILVVASLLPSAAMADLKIVATTSDLASIAAEIGGDHVEVTAMALPTRCCAVSAPGSTRPRLREPMTRSASSAWMGAVSRGSRRGFRCFAFGFWFGIGRGFDFDNGGRLFPGHFPPSRGCRRHPGAEPKRRSR